MKQAVCEGKVEVSGVDDVLTKVLGNPEHKGRVRGQGVHVKQSTYFNLPRPKRKRTMDEKIQESVQKFVAEETEKIVKQRDAFWMAEIEKLKGSLSEKITRAEGSPMIDSQQGSCSKGAQGILKELDVSSCVKKKLDLVEDQNVDEKNEKVEDVVPIGGGDNEIEILLEKSVKDDLGCSEWLLAVGNTSNVVAYATMETDVPSGNQILHGVPVAKENARVSITRVIQGSAAIPFPIQDEITTVEQAVGTYIAWPRELILEVKTSVSPVEPTKKVTFF